MSRNLPDSEASVQNHIAQVKKAKDEWESTLDSLPQLICLLDDRGRILRTNKTIETWRLGRLGKVIGMGIHELFHPECTDTECYMENYWSRAKQEITEGRAHDCEAEDKELGRYLRLQFQPIVPQTGRDKREAASFAVIIAYDITESKRADKDRVLLATTMEQADESIMITDTEGIIQYVNPSAVRVSGYTRGDLIGQKTSIFKSGKHDRAFYRDLWDTIKSGKVWRGSFINKKKDGTLHYEKQTITPVLDSSGAIMNFVATKRDVTHEVMLEERLRQSLKMEAIGLMAGGIAHEINQPLNSIKVTADGMLFWHAERKETLPDKAFRKLEKISREVDRIDATIRHMRSFFRRDSQAKPQPVALKNIVRNALSLIIRKDNIAWHHGA